MNYIEPTGHAAESQDRRRWFGGRWELVWFPLLVRSELRPEFMERASGGGTLMPGTERVKLLFIAVVMVLVGALVFRYGPGFARVMAESSAKRAGIAGSAPNPFSPVQTLGKWLSRAFGTVAIAGGAAVTGMVILGFWGLDRFAEAKLF